MACGCSGQKCAITVDMESETVRRNVKKRAAFGGMYVPILWLRCNVSSRPRPSRGRGRQHPPELRHTFAAITYQTSRQRTRKPIQASTFSPNMVATCVGIVLESRISMSLILDVLKLLILSLDRVLNQSSFLFQVSSRSCKNAFGIRRLLIPSCRDHTCTFNEFSII
jgi:hypothetical protein